MKKQSRSSAREALFIQIFQFDDLTDINEITASLFENNPECEDNRGYITTVLQGVFEHSDELDAIISARLKKGWTLSRISKVSHIILRLAIYEMLYIDDVPPKVAINEAVELSKSYGSETDPAFINGLLGNVFNTMCKQ